MMEAEGAANDATAQHVMHECVTLEPLSMMELIVDEVRGDVEFVREAIGGDMFCCTLLHSTRWEIFQGLQVLEQVIFVQLAVGTYDIGVESGMIRPSMCSANTTGFLKPRGMTLSYH